MAAQAKSQESNGSDGEESVKLVFGGGPSLKEIEREECRAMCRPIMQRTVCVVACAAVSCFVAQQCVKPGAADDQDACGVHLCMFVLACGFV